MCNNSLTCTFRAVAKNLSLVDLRPAICWTRDLVRLQPTRARLARILFFLHLPLTRVLVFLYLFHLHLNFPISLPLLGSFFSCLDIQLFPAPPLLVSCKTKISGV